MSRQVQQGLVARWGTSGACPVDGHVDYLLSSEGAGRVCGLQLDYPTPYWEHPSAVLPKELAVEMTCFAFPLSQWKQQHTSGRQRWLVSTLGPWLKMISWPLVGDN